MSSRNLEHLFGPRSVAVIGASDRPHSVGATVMRNLLRGEFSGPVWPVNVRHTLLPGANPIVRSTLPDAPDLAVICTPAPTMLGLITALGSRGIRAAVVISASSRRPPAAGSSPKRCCRPQWRSNCRFSAPTGPSHPRRTDRLLIKVDANQEHAVTGSLCTRVDGHRAALCTPEEQAAASRYQREPEAIMMNMMQGCSGWLMAVGGIVTYGTMILAAASIKYLFVDRPSAP